MSCTATTVVGGGQRHDERDHPAPVGNALEHHAERRALHQRVSIHGTHVHLLVEAEDKDALSRGMQRFQISAAKHINRAFSRRARLVVRRRGTVFPDRFHQEIITSPRQARRALAYVLNNWRKHREDHAREWRIDPFSTGVLFGGWRELEDQPWLWRWRDTYDPLLVYRPRTWLLRNGWALHGSISCHDVPSTR